MRAPCRRLARRHAIRERIPTCSAPRRHRTALFVVACLLQHLKTKGAEVCGAATKSAGDVAKRGADDFVRVEQPRGLDRYLLERLDALGDGIDEVVLFRVMLIEQQM